MKRRQEKRTGKGRRGKGDDSGQKIMDDMNKEQEKEERRERGGSGRRGKGVP